MEIDKVKCFHKYINLIYCNTKTIRNDEYIKILADLYTFPKKEFLHQPQLQISQSEVYEIGNQKLPSTTND